MRIYLLNASNTYNYGSMMMAENFITYYNKATGQSHTYFVETDDPVNTRERLCQATGYEDIQVCPMGSLYKNNRITKPQMLQALAVKSGIASKLAATMDLIVVLGGDDYTEDYGWIPLVSQFLKINVFLRKKKVCFIGQTMGPFYSFRKPVARFFLNKTDRLYVRDRITFDYLDRLGVKRIDSIPDLALMPLAKESTEAGEKRYISFFPSQLIFNYTVSKSREECLGFYLKVCTHLLEAYPEYTLALIPHVLKPQSSDDSIMVRDLYAHLPEDLKSRVLALDKTLLPYEVRSLIKQSAFTVSARMHPVVSSIECGVPSLCFSYSQKYWGVIGEGYGLGDFILDVRNTSFNDLYEKFTASIDKLCTNAYEISETMLRKNASDQALILQKLKEI